MGCENRALRAFDGEWIDTEGDTFLVAGSCVRLPGGEVCRFEILGKDRCSMEVDGGGMCSGRLTTQGILRWSDGDTWAPKGAYRIVPIHEGARPGGAGAGGSAGEVMEWDGDGKVWHWHVTLSGDAPEVGPSGGRRLVFDILHGEGSRVVAHGRDLAGLEVLRPGGPVPVAHSHEPAAEASSWALEGATGASFFVLFDPWAVALTCELVDVHAFDSLWAVGGPPSPDVPAPLHGALINHPLVHLFRGGVLELSVTGEVAPATPQGRRGLRGSGALKGRRRMAFLRSTCSVTHQGVVYSGRLTPDGQLRWTWSEGEDAGEATLRNALWSPQAAMVPTWAGQYVASVEDRAMLLSELQGLRNLIMEQCIKCSWVNPRTHAALQPKDVNLYHLNYCHICPSTAPRGIELRGLQPGTYTQGQQVRQAQPKVAHGLVMEATTGSNVRVAIVRGWFGLPEGGERWPITIGSACCGEPQEVLCPGSISYKELVSAAPCKPTWFCSHWWGESVLDFIACCEEHAAQRQLLGPTEASYWICAYANRQHDLGSDIAADPDASSFRRAMLLANGVLLILDPKATPFARIWCDFELYRTVLEPTKLLDIVTLCEGCPRLLADGLLPGDGARGREYTFEKTEREQDFPINLIRAGLLARLERGEASREIDKVRILNCMKRNFLSLDDAAVLQTLEEDRDVYDTANVVLHGRLAIAVWPQAVKKGLVLDLELPAVLRRDVRRTGLLLDLQQFEEATDSELEALAQGLPLSLQTLTLYLSECPRVTDAGLAALAQALPPGLLELELGLSDCGAITVVGVRALARLLPAGLVALRLDLERSAIGHGFSSPQELRAWAGYASGGGSPSP